MSPRARVTFRPIASTRVHEEVAEQLRRHIALRLVGPAGALPPERDLARLFGVGRATVQRAIALLEADGLVERRRGRRGGTFVVGAVDSGADGARLVRALSARRAEIAEALDFRLSTEPTAAALAASVASPSELAAVERALEAAAAAPTDAEFMEHDTDFHLAIGRASGNRFLADSVERVRLVLNDALAALPDSDAWHAWSNDEHRLVLRALGSRDAERARDAMAAHVLHADDAMRALLASLPRDA
ncbi:MAG TPA: FCD domain-containing protein [Gaiellaceae bacterium]|nr:FCD domain-containing protein [Gaiellaceae bacterium]